MRNKQDWLWMPHAGHFIRGSDCRFHLNTCVGDFIVSTVGEYWPDREVRRIMASSRGITINGRGDLWDADYMEKIGYETIGCDRLYETMVFRAVPAPDDQQCCPMTMESGSELDFEGYNDAAEAYRGHLRMCEKWASKTLSDVLAGEVD